MNNEYTIIDVVEDISKEGFLITKFVLNYFYKVSNITALKSSLDEYMISRFSERLEYFVYEHSKLSDNEKKEFYTKLVNNKQNLNYLYDFIEKARTSLYDIQARLLARLSVDLVRHNTLKYHEVTLLNMILSLNDIDIKNIHKCVKVTYDINKIGYTYGIFIFNSQNSHDTYKTCIRLGLFNELNTKNFNIINLTDIVNIDTKNYPYEKIVTDPLTFTFINLIEEVINQK